MLSFQVAASPRSEKHRA
ncbi:hypothetical protein [Lysobacter enzymogenes]